MRPRHLHFYLRLLTAGGLFILGSLLLGTAGYRYTENMPWLDALLNTSMILGGMGPVDTLHSATGKLFASFYALYSCFVVLGMAGLLFMPAMHAVLNRFHSNVARQKPD